ncbi:hypothetical protein ACGFH8_30630 [Micromonospora sp. NPDC049175]|uniref:hypothetical protein n=1 Tax=Micromonospora sp. NPDC049175 TaxID=3364266 RepID=UPI0037196F14
MQGEREPAAGLGEERPVGAFGPQGCGVGVLVGDVADVPRVPGAGELSSGAVQPPGVVLGVELGGVVGDRAGQGGHRAAGQVGADGDLREQLPRPGVGQRDPTGWVRGQHGLGEPVEQLAGESRVGRPGGATGLAGRGHRPTSPRV